MAKKPEPIELVRDLYERPKIPPPKPVRIIPQGAPADFTKAPPKKNGRPRRFNYPY